MSKVLVVMEQKGDAGWHRISLEALAAGQKLAAELGVTCSAVVLGESAAIGPLASELATKKLDTAWSVDHALLANYTADGWVAVLQQLIAQEQPQYVVFPHTYQVRDYAPALATRLGQVLISDVTAIHAGPVFVRQWMQGKLNAEYAHKGAGVCLVSVQAGSFRADAVEAGSSEVKTFAPQIDAAQIRTKPSEPFREAAQTVDLSAAQVIVSVGRGIGEQENLGLVEELAAALGAELAASRPICDAGWLPMERQVGSSGQTVAPKLYLAVGISGAIQHLVGMKGAKTVIAINKDADAPIFEIADIGVVGDLFEVVPALTKAIRGAV
ncbi:electron transfer flavoprotein subunit alpha/FixB family protein [Granulicella sp. S156]|uniref:electron transfer flavoprotein subunit alpha/FixB family protein n=1 Tax=Granulicella sp. S156 TaxID=1747224 RepID=UPI0020B11620|nr:electron transfer flavoprotein subunit alpha/FixB family protein [Granulicella sp. S156]